MNTTRGPLVLPSRRVLGRLENYAASGHGGNNRLLAISASDYQVSVLEVASSSASIEDGNPLEAKAVQPAVWAERELIVGTMLGSTIQPSSGSTSNGIPYLLPR